MRKKDQILRFFRKSVKVVAVFYWVLFVCLIYIILISDASFADVFNVGSSQNKSSYKKEIIVDTSVCDEYGGISCLTKNLIEQMAKERKDWRFNLLLRKRNKTFEKLTELENIKIIETKEMFSVFEKGVFDFLNKVTFGLAQEKLIQLISYGNIFLNDNVDLFWDPIGGRYFSDISVPKITTIHDTTEVDKPEFMQKLWVGFRREKVLKGLVYSQKVIAVSNFTKERIMDAYGVKSDKIVTIPIRLAKRVQFNSDLKKISSTLQKYGLTNNNYLIFVSQYYANKNHKRLIQAFSNFIKNNPDYNNLKLAIVGDMSNSNEMIEAFAKLYDKNNNIVFTGVVENEELSVLLNNAMFFIHPSLYEGFGMPIVEAMSYGIPVACSNVASLPEIAGDAAVYFDPYDITDMERVILKLVQSSELRKDLTKKSYIRSKKFEASADMIRDYIKIFNEVMR